MKYCCFILFFLGFIYYSTAQEKPIYYFKERYSPEVVNFINSSDINFKEIKIMAGYMFNPYRSRRDVVNYKQVDKFLKKLFPEKDDTGILCIDLENQSYQDLKGRYINKRGNNKANEVDFNKATKVFINLLTHIKTERPNVKVGFYGLPFKIYSKDELREGYEKKLDPILKKADIIFPSIYNPHLSEQDSYDYFKMNLDIAFNYSERLDKPVIPFFWYLLFSPDKKVQYEMIPKDKMKKYINFIENYRTSDGLGVSGIIWWDSSTQYNKKVVKQNLIEKSGRDDNGSINSSFLYYFKSK